MTTPSRTTAYVMNLDKRPDRWRNMCELWSLWLDLERVSGIIVDDNTRHHSHTSSDGLGQTHMKLLRELADTDAKTVLIFEDDAVPEPGWFGRWCEIKKYLDEHLDEWDVFNGGAHQLKECYGVVELNKSVLLDGNRCCASHFMYLNMASVKKFLQWEDNKRDIDVWYCGTGFKMFCSYPILAKQADGHSNIIEDEREWKDTYISNESHFRRHLGDLYYKYNVIHDANQLW
jgi:hypothetical protein